MRSTRSHLRERGNRLICINAAHGSMMHRGRPDMNYAVRSRYRVSRPPQMS